MGPFEGEVELPLALLEYSVSSAATCFCLPLFGTFQNISNSPDRTGTWPRFICLSDFIVSLAQGTRENLRRIRPTRSLPRGGWTAAVIRLRHIS